MQFVAEKMYSHGHGNLIIKNCMIQKTLQSEFLLSSYITVY